MTYRAWRTEADASVNGPRGTKIKIPQMRQLGAGSVDSAQEGGSTASCSLEDGEDATMSEQEIRAIPLKYAEFGNSSLIHLGLMRSHLQLATTTGLISL